MSVTPSTSTVLWRGVCLRCPNCGKGRLLKGYIKQVPACAVCHESYVHIRADDGPAWLTILMVGHIVAPLMLTLAQYTDLSVTMQLLIVLPLAVLLTLVILPHAKGIFLAVIWKMHARKKASPPHT